MSDFTVVLSNLINDPMFLTACLHVMREFRHYYEKLRGEGSGRQASPRGGPVHLEGYLQVDLRWRKYVEHLATEAVRALGKDRLGTWSMADISQRTDEAEAAIDTLITPRWAEAGIQRDLQQRLGKDQWTNTDLSAAARTIVLQIVKDEVLWKTCVLDTLEEVRLLISGKLTEQQLREMFSGLKGLIRARPFLDLHAQVERARDQSWAFVQPPVAVDGNDTTGFSAELLLRLVCDSPGTTLGVRGVAGIGKSRLVRELVCLLAQDGREDSLVPVYLAPHKYRRSSRQVARSAQPVR